MNRYPKDFGDKNSPFSNRAFYKLLEDSNLLNEETGWQAKYFTHNNSILPSFIKSHSYGEYIFDWAWANFYEQNNINYYPKLIHATPFTPVNAPKCHGNIETELFKKSYEYYQQNNFSGEHYLFINEKEFEQLKPLGFKKMKTIQYHFLNKWSSFDDFLCSLKTNRKKMIKKERKKTKTVKTSWLTQDQCNKETLESLFLLYISTIAKKNSYAYLNREFFQGLKVLLNKEVEILIAKDKETIFAMSIFFKSETTLYGRYWGIHPKYEQDHKLLHFEMCYYKGIDYTIENNLILFEAGAQGEQKLWRGFTPVEILSAHHIKNPVMFKSISHYIDQMNQQTESEIKRLSQFLPFKEEI